MVSAADKAGLPHPNVVAESGRALTAHHSVLVFNVLETTALPLWNEQDYPVKESDPEALRELHAIHAKLSNNGLLEAWHDALQIREDVLDGFNLGLFDLKTRAVAERLFWSIAQKLHRLAGEMKNPPFELQNLSKLLAEKYFCNFSLFQSLPDAWAIDQIFPIMPIQRLDEEPTSQVTLQDITCDSDGQIDHFIHSGELARSLPLHPLKAGEAYYLGAYLVGAYQEILGDLHNLFGDTHAVHVVVEGDGYHIEQVIDGESVADVLDYVQFSPKKLVRDMETWVSASVKEGKITLQEGKDFLANYRSGLYGYTYLE
jgi:arginine decarboxylase